VSRFRFGMALSGLLLVILLIFAPARLLGLFLPADVAVMQGFGGNLWRGSAARTVVAVGQHYVNLGSVEWQLAPLSLLTLAPTVTLESRWGKQILSGQITLRGRNSVDIKDLDATVSAQLVRQFSPFLIEGDFMVQETVLSIRDGLLASGEGRILWRNAAWLSHQGSRPLGSYALEFQQQPGQALLGEVSTVSGPVKAAGELELLGRSYAVDITLDSANGLDAPLQETLSLFARPVGDAYRIQLNGAL
jgi:general secretion pathway protein N